MSMTKTYGEISYDAAKDRWAIDKADPHICIKIKAIFPKISKSARQPFLFTNLPEVCFDLIWFTERYPLRISDKDLSLLKRSKKKYQDNINELERILLPDYQPACNSLNEGELARNYQLTGNELYLKAKRLLIGDDLGLGKTLIAILSFLDNRTTPALVVVQTHMPAQWQSFIERFTKLTIHQIKVTKPYNLPPADVYITKYSCLAGWSNFFETGFFKSAVFDEVQELRREVSDKYKAAKILSDHADFCLGLSATPIYNYGNEIFNVIDAIKQGGLGMREDFTREWCGGRNFAIVQNPEALGTYLRDNFLMLRRTRKEVGRELPAVNVIIQTVSYSEHDYQKAEELAYQLAIKVVSGTFMERGQASRELDIMMRHNTGVAKARGIAECVKILLENNQPVLLAGWHRDVYEIWKEEFAQYSPAFYTGTESPTQKEQAKQDFISGKTNLLIISLISGVGMDGLQHRCNTVVIGELHWSPKVHEQLIARLDRDGQKERVTVIYTVCDEGSDPPMIDMLGLKASQSHNIIDPLLAVPDQYTDESRMRVFAEKYLASRNKPIPKRILEIQ